MSIGIFINNKLVRVPIVPKEFAETGIIAGKAVITGNFTKQDAEQISAQLRSRTLPVDLEIVEMKTDHRD